MSRSFLTLLFLSLYYSSSTTLSNSSVFTSAAIVKTDIEYPFTEELQQNVFAEPLWPSTAGIDDHLTPNNHGGVVKRFDVSKSTKIRDKVIGISQTHNLDVWHLGSSYIDIYFPQPAVSKPSSSPLSSTAPVVPPELAEIPHSTRSVPALSTSPLNRNVTSKAPWKLDTLENSTFHETYHPLDEVETFLHGLVEEYPDLAKLKRIGLSAEGRDMWALTLEHPDDEHPDHPEPEPLPEPQPQPPKEGDPGEEPEELEVRQPGGGKKGGGKKGGKKHKPHPPHKLNFVIVGAQHAREWIATATSLYIAHALAVHANVTSSFNKTTEPHSLSLLLHTFNFHIIPVPNPDGYVYTWEHDRYWYKNRQVISPRTKCVGVDMNRNWGYQWHHEPVNGPNGPKGLRPPHPVDPCSHWYPGTRAFESPEANNIANYVDTLPDLIGFVDLRSYGQMLSYPYSYTCKRTAKDAEDLAEAAFGAIQAIKNSHGTHFDSGSLCDNLYKAPGNILDWMYSKAGIKYSYVAHLRDTGTYGFTLPEKWIRPVGEETASMIAYLAKFIAFKLDRKL